MARGLVLDREAQRMESVKADVDQALEHFGQGDLLAVSIRLRSMRDSINKSLATIRRRGAR